MKYITQLIKTVKPIVLSMVDLLNFNFENFKIKKRSNATVPIPKTPIVSRKYSDLIKWQDQMLKDVGLNIPPGGWNDHTSKSKPSSDIQITFIKRKTPLKKSV